MLFSVYESVILGVFESVCMSQCLGESVCVCEYICLSLCV